MSWNTQYNIEYGVIKCPLGAFVGIRKYKIKVGAEVMNQNQRIPQNNSSIAWFKIANLIERKEREKALSVYKLMSHSLQDRAYALQLEGDILWYFEEIPEACLKYLQSAFLYRNAKRWLDAVSLYEQVLLLDPNNCDALIYSVPCYAQLAWEQKFKQNLEIISTFCIAESIR